MTASKLLLYGLLGFLALLLLKKSGIAFNTTLTSAQTGGTQPVVPKGDFATIADDITNIFDRLVPAAQTSPKTV